VEFAETLPIQLHQSRDLVYELTIRLVPSSRFPRPIFHLTVLSRDGLIVSYRVRRANTHPSSEIVTYLAAIPGDVTTRTPLIYTSRRLAPFASVDAFLLGVTTIAVRNLIADSKESLQLARKKLDIRNKFSLSVHTLSDVRAHLHQFCIFDPKSGRSIHEEMLVGIEDGNCVSYFSEGFWDIAVDWKVAYPRRESSKLEPARRVFEIKADDGFSTFFVCDRKTESGEKRLSCDLAQEAPMASLAVVTAER
jgi:hypothetical protein